MAKQRDLMLKIQNKRYKADMMSRVYDFEKENLFDKEGDAAPKYVQKVLKQAWAIKAINKAKEYLGL